MRIFTFLFIFFILISCEKEPQKKVISKPKIIQTKFGKIIPIDSAKIFNLKDSIVTSFYRNLHFRTCWLADDSRKNIISLFENAESEGLFSKDYNLKEIHNSEKNIKNLNDSLLVNYDILLTENLLKYIQKATKGSLNPKALYVNWDLKEKNYNFKELLLNFQKKDSFTSALNKVIPTYIVYKQLKDALKLINEFPAENYKKIELPTKLVLNDTNKVVIDIKKKLMYWKDLNKQDSLTPIYDSITQLAVQKFQMRHGLAPDGVIGVGTIAALNISKEQRKEQIIVNMEKWRWYSRKFENEYLIINIPNYELDVIKNGDTLQTHKIIVGKKERETPILSSKFSYIVFNPTWTVPPTILKKDVLPAATKDRNYFAKKNITVYNFQNKIVNPSDWNPKKGFNYKYVQSPGAYNSLGEVKFIFPNKFSVYLHDTNSRGYFIKDVRALSSGCVRVQNPLELTEYFLNDEQNWNLDKIEETVKLGVTKQVNLKKDVYLYILYWTAWSENGKLQFRDDLYNLDVNLYSLLKN